MTNFYNTMKGLIAISKRQHSRIEIQVSPQEKVEIFDYADKMNMSVSAFIKKAVNRYIGLLETKENKDEKEK